MVDVSAKDRTARRALAGGQVKLRSDVMDMILEGTAPKGDVLQVARIAGIQAAKKTSELIPLCHPLALTDVKIFFEADRENNVIEIKAEARAMDRTGVEMEAITAATVAALTVYDMCKAAQKDIEIGPFVLLEKDGGKSGRYSRENGGK